MTGTPTKRLRRRARALGAVVALLALGSSACASAAEDSDASVGRVEATPQFLVNAAERSQKTSHRMEMLISMTGDVSNLAPVATGDFDGDAFHIQMDMGVLFDEMAGAFGEPAGEPADLFGDLTIEMAGDDEVLFIRAPMFAAIGEMVPPGEDLGAAADLARLGDGWGMVHLNAFGELTTAEMQEAVTGGMGIDPQRVIDLIKEAQSVEELGTDVLRGVEVTGLSAEVALADVLEASGSDPDAMADLNAYDGADEAFTRELWDMTIPVSVWVDDEGLVRRLEYGYSMSETLGLAGEDVGTDTFAMDDLEMRIALDMFDYGDDLSIEMPSGAVDVTEAFAAFAEA